MSLSVRLAAAGMAATAMIVGAGVAHAQEAPLVSVLDDASVLDEAALAPNVSPGVALICAQNGQQGKGNIIGGDLTQSCSQTATQTNTGGSGGNGGGGVSGAQVIAGSGTTIAPGAFGSSYAYCPEGQVATGGGFDSSEPGDAEPGGFRVTYNQPITVLGEGPTPRSWSVSGYNESEGDVFLRAWVVCVDEAE